MSSDWRRDVRCLSVRQVVVRNNNGLVGQSPTTVIMWRDDTRNKCRICSKTTTTATKMTTTKIVVVVTSKRWPRQQAVRRALKGATSADQVNSSKLATCCPFFKVCVCVCVSLFLCCCFHFPPFHRVAKREKLVIQNADVRFSVMSWPALSKTAPKELHREEAKRKRDARMGAYLFSVTESGAMKSP